ncbi:hypothetical protein GGP41_006189 [Bipolaris sorokiniana]|uniref:Uncharacterized protein n=2 Tax=Cochliobolus sativus TaxID=45130 RepID=A0A8H5ZJH6_COCSA|nr:uncharacterized protein COCSADRAFT_349108 [Bipolaris sorokiniana ND90Pr]EMD58760.1 hypothetical protein COCSADRAFT_349108 [Bipolaris sorokiniana ND90Pr]KAF5849260.1 hypothetical protein GGP41_006189 [Bipolaris sorokiniana]
MWLAAPLPTVGGATALKRQAIDRPSLAVFGDEALCQRFNAACKEGAIRRYAPGTIPCGCTDVLLIAHPRQGPAAGVMGLGSNSPDHEAAIAAIAAAAAACAYTSHTVNWIWKRLVMSVTNAVRDVG